MSTVANAFAQALYYHQTGLLSQAEQLYRQILQVDPRHADSLHLLGVIFYQTGKPHVAVEYIRQAIAIHPWAAAYHNNLGAACQALGLREDAETHCRQALQLQPDYPDAHNNLGNVLQELGRLDEAVRHCQEALRLRPDFAEALNNLGNAQQRQGKLPEAAASYQQALRLRPDHAEPHNNLGVVLAELGRVPEAITHYNEALRLRPNYADAFNNLGNALRDQGKLDETVACYEQALKLRPDYAEARTNLGSALRDKGLLDEAVACYQQALRLKPNHAEAHNNLGNALRYQGKLDEALASFERALQAQPDFADGHWNRSLIWLLQGNFAQGWPAYEWRWRCKQLVPRAFQQPRWDGSPLGGRTILLHWEQGLGDTIQFIRYAPLVKERGGRVLFQCQSVLASLLATCPGIDQLLLEGAPLPDFAVHSPLLSLPAILGTALETIPANVPYVTADPQHVERWRAELGPIAGYKIGIAWQGNPKHKGDRHRSFRLTQFEPLAAVEGVRLFSLQMDAGIEQLAGVAGRFAVTDLGSRFDAASFRDVAAVMKNLDLVITVDSALAHLAGAMAVPVWLAVPFAPDFRWLLEREDSPWYPTMRLFRQKQLGNWEEVFARMTSTLKKTSFAKLIGSGGELV
jgi:tetratricopeptide (TPR) repeat protein